MASPANLHCYSVWPVKTRRKLLPKFAPDLLTTPVSLYEVRSPYAPPVSKARPNHTRPALQLNDESCCIAMKPFFPHGALLALNSIHHIIEAIRTPPVVALHLFASPPSAPCWCFLIVVDPLFFLDVVLEAEEPQSRCT